MILGNVAMLGTFVSIMVNVLFHLIQDVKPRRIVHLGNVALLGIFVATVLLQEPVGLAGDISMVFATNSSRVSYPGLRPGITVKIKRTSVLYFL